MTDTINLPDAVNFYFSNAARGVAIDNLLEEPAFSKSISMKELRDYANAKTTAEYVRYQYWKFMCDMWFEIWAKPEGDIASIGNKKLTYVPFANYKRIDRNLPSAKDTWEAGGLGMYAELGVAKSDKSGSAKKRRIGAAHFCGMGVFTREDRDRSIWLAFDIRNNSFKSFSITLPPGWEDLREDDEWECYMFDTKISVTNKATSVNVGAARKAARAALGCAFQERD